MKCPVCKYEPANATDFTAVSGAMALKDTGDRITHFPLTSCLQCGAVFNPEAGK